MMVSKCFSQIDFQKNEHEIDSIMNANIIHTGKKPVHSFLLYAQNGKTRFEVHKGFGTIGRNNTVIDADYQYNCASITKTFVATIILQLQEEGKLTLADKAYKYLEITPFIQINNVHILRDTNYSKEITIEQLLQHTSGIADIFTDAATRFNISVLLHKKRQYTTEKIMNRFYKYNLNEKPKNKPGLGYHYSDMNYMLLGFIIENITNQSLAQAIRERILEKTNMNDTYFEYYEPIRSNGKRVDAFLGKINMTKKINTSYEWGGGGLVTTTKDLGNFIKALFNNQYYKRDATLKKMIDFTNTKILNANYGLGLFSFEVNGHLYYGHGGFYGSALLYDPINKIVFSANISQATAPYDTGKLAAALLTIIEKE